MACGGKVDSYDMLESTAQDVRNILKPLQKSKANSEIADMVPADKPVDALHLFKTWLDKKPL